MQESWHHVTVLQVEVVVGAKYVGGDDTGEHAAVLLVISPVRGGGREGRGGREGGEGRGGREGREGGREGREAGRGGSVCNQVQ